MDSITLPVSGKSVTFRRLKARDYIEAERVIADRESSKQYGFAILARKCVFDGVQALYEDILDLDEDDLAALMGGLTPDPKGSE